MAFWLAVILLLVEMLFLSRRYAWSLDELVSG